MSRVREMQGVSAQIVTLKSDGKRRHPSYCIFAEGRGKSRRCTCPQSTMYYEPCFSAAKCQFYERKEGEDK